MAMIMDICGPSHMSLEKGICWRDFSIVTTPMIILGDYILK